MFNHVREQLWKKLNAWNTKLLSAAGKEALIKGGKEFLGWDGGTLKLLTGWWNFEAFNKAMVAKQAWRILEYPTIACGAWRVWKIRNDLLHGKNEP
ncbi:unnamed protein product [Prunus armeniaca]